MIDLEKLTKILNDSSREIQNISSEVQKSPQKAQELLLQFVPKITEGYNQLKSASFEDFQASVRDPAQRDRVRTAIQKFLVQTKDMQEKAGAVQAALFQHPAFKDFTTKLKDLNNFLKRGEKVEKVDQEGL